MGAPADFDPLEVELFLMYIKEGSGELTAALSVGWSGADLKRFKRDTGNLALIQEARTCLDESIVQMLARNARAGNQRAIETWIFNRLPDQWRPATQRQIVELTGVVDHTVKISVVDAVRELIAAGETAALMAPIEEAEIVDDGQ